MKKSIKQLIPICCFFLCAFTGYAQILTDYPCFAVAKNNGTINNLHAYSPVNHLWDLVGNTSTQNIAAIAVDSEAGILYAVDSAPVGSTEPANFGTIDLQSGLFTAIGNLGEAIGEKGTVLLNQIEGLTYDNIDQIMYAVHRVDGTGQGTNDLLFQIDVATGLAITGAMKDNQGNPADYAIIEALTDGTANGVIYDVSDIAISPEVDDYYYSYGGQPGNLFAVHAENGPGVLSILDKTNGYLNAVVYDFPNDDVESLGFTYLGELYATSGDNGYTGVGNNSFIYIDVNAASTINLSYIDIKSPIDVDFESFDCFHKATSIQPNCTPQINFSGIINSGEYIAETITTNEEIRSFTTIDADIECKASDYVLLQNILVSKGCDFSINIDADLCN